MSEQAADRPIRGYVYFFFSSVTKQTKIGQSRSPASRLQTIRCHVPNVEVLGTIGTDDPIWLEKILHGAFAAKRAQGEWFDLGEEERSALTSLPEAVFSFSDLPLPIRAAWVLTWIREHTDDEGKVRLRFPAEFAVTLELIDAIVDPNANGPSRLVRSLLTSELGRLLASLPETDRAALDRVTGLRE